MPAVLFNIFMAGIAAVAFYNIYKGRNPGPGAKSVKGGKQQNK
jgi:hypothetical protein